MKRSLLTLVTIVLLTASSFAQVAINTTGDNPNASAILDISSTDKGLLIPRMTTDNRTNSITPVTALLVYDTDTESFWYYDGTQLSWIEIKAGSALDINSLADGKTDVSSVFVGNQAGANDDGDNSNTGIGIEALKSNTAATQNTAVGSKALEYTNIGGANSAFGAASLRHNTTGLKNTSIGRSALYYSQTGSNNTALGYMAGLGTDGSSISRCVFIGFESGKNNTSNDKLFIANSDDATPLIGGDFSTDQVDINGTIKITGGTPGSGKVLTSDADGFATWETKTYGATEINGLSDARADTKSVFLGGGSGTNDDGDNYNTALGINAMAANTSGEQNVAIGNAALANNTVRSDLVAIGDSALYTNNGTGFYLYGSKNTAIGASALFSNTTGYTNTAIGYNTMYSNTTGVRNTAVGETALYSNTSGKNNTAIGRQSLYTNTTGEENTALGIYALYSNVDGDENTAVGMRSLGNHKTGDDNVAVGYEALYSDTSGIGNTAIGHGSMYDNTNGNGNTAVGNRSLSDNTTGDYNTAIGRRSLADNTTANGNTATGYESLFYDTTGAYNTANGYKSMRSNRSGDYNTALGYSSMYHNITGNSNVAIGIRSLYSNTDRSNLVAIGDSALYNNGIGATQNSDGTSNTAIGSKSSYSNTTGHNNTSVGYKSFYSNTTGIRNTSLGMEALTDNTEGGDNTAIGVWALANNTIGSSNCALGEGASGFNTTGNSNTSVGLWAGRINSTGNYNVSVGTQSVYHNSTGSNNTGIGYMAGYGSNGSNTSGCVFLGYEAGKNNTSDNKLFITNSDDSTPLIGGDFSTDRVDINGTIKITGGTPGANKVLTSDADGLAAWETKTYGATELNGLSDAETTADNLFLGENAGQGNLSNAHNNTAIGINALKINQTGSNLVALGTGAAYSNRTISNIAIGVASLSTNEWGAYNVAIGDSTLFNLNGNSWSGNYNTAIGNKALYSNSAGYENVAIGNKSLYSNISGDENVAIGVEAGYSCLGNNNIFIGNQAGKFEAGSNKLFIDNSSTTTPLIGGDFYADRVDINGTIKITGGTPGVNKVLTSDASGNASWETKTYGATELNGLSDAITDGSSIFVGDQVGTNDDGTNYNTVMGDEAFKTNTTGVNNTGFGYKTLEVSNGGGNSALGQSALRKNTSGNYNTSIGMESLYYNETGNNNTAIGYEAGESTSGNSISGGVFLGYQAGKANTSNNKLFIDNSSTTTPLIGGDFSSNELYLNADVGVGTNSPNELLEVAGTSGASARMNISNGGGSDRYTILFVSPNTTDDFARIEAYKYGTASGGKTLKINTAGNGEVIIGGHVLPEFHKGKNLGASGTAWNNVYADDFVNEGAAAFANVNVTKQLISFPPKEKKAGAFDEFTDKGLKELDPASLPKELTENNALLIDEMTTYNYKANYEQQQQIETLKKENAELKARLEKLEKLMEGLK